LISQWRARCHSSNHKTILLLIESQKICTNWPNNQTITGKLCTCGWNLWSNGGFSYWRWSTGPLSTRFYIWTSNWLYHFSGCILLSECHAFFDLLIIKKTGSNPHFADKITAISPLRRSSIQFTYFKKVKEGVWSLSYKNKYIEAETFLMEKEGTKVLFLPATQGQPPAVLLAFILNMARNFFS